MRQHSEPVTLSRRERRRRETAAQRTVWRAGLAGLALWLGLLLVVGLVLPAFGPGHATFKGAVGQRLTIGASDRPSSLSLTPAISSIDLGEVALGGRVEAPGVLSVTNHGPWPAELRLSLDGVDNVLVGMDTPRLAPGATTTIDLTLFGRQPGGQHGTLTLWAGGSARLHHEIAVSFAVVAPAATADPAGDGPAQEVSE